MSVRGQPLRNDSLTTSNTHPFDIDQPFFTSNIQFAWCPSDRVQEFCGDGPIVPQDLKSRKRASGLDLVSTCFQDKTRADIQLRPKSSKGQSRGDSGIPCPAILSPTITSPPLPSNWTLSKQSLSPRPYVDQERSSLRAPAQSKHGKEGSWDIVDEFDLYPRSIRSSAKIPVAQSQGFVSPAEIPLQWGSGSEGSMQWMSGDVQLQMKGRGGRDGGELRVHGDTTVRYRSLPLADMSALQYHSHDTSSPIYCWFTSPASSTSPTMGDLRHPTHPLISPESTARPIITPTRFRKITLDNQ